jgi:hypothetical protein
VRPADGPPARPTPIGVLRKPVAPAPTAAPAASSAPAAPSPAPLRPAPEPEPDILLDGAADDPVELEVGPVVSAAGAGNEDGIEVLPDELPALPEAPELVSGLDPELEITDSLGAPQVSQQPPEHGIEIDLSDDGPAGGDGETLADDLFDRGARDLGGDDDEKS